MRLYSKVRELLPIYLIFGELFHRKLFTFLNSMNVKELREKKGLTQIELAEKTGIPRARIAKWEQGKGSPKSADEKTLFAFFGEDVLISSQGGQILNDSGNGAENYIQKRRALKGISEPVTVPLLPAKAQAGYVRSFDQVTFLEALEKYALPPGVDHRGAIWRYFEVEGESMSPTFESGDIVLASMVPQMDWQEIRNFYIYIILTDTELYIKRVYRKSNKNWVLISDNEKQNPQVLIPVENIKEVWVFRRHIDSKAPPPRKIEIKV